MKKIIVLISAFSVITLTACGQTDTSENIESEIISAEQTTEETAVQQEETETATEEIKTTVQEDMTETPEETAVQKQTTVS